MIIFFLAFGWAQEYKTCIFSLKMIFTGSSVFRTGNTMITTSTGLVDFFNSIVFGTEFENDTAFGSAWDH